MTKLDKIMRQDGGDIWNAVKNGTYEHPVSLGLATLIRTDNFSDWRRQSAMALFERTAKVLSGVSFEFTGRDMIAISEYLRREKVIEAPNMECNSDGNRDALYPIAKAIYHQFTTQGLEGLNNLDTVQRMLANMDHSYLEGRDSDEVRDLLDEFKLQDLRHRQFCSQYRIFNDAMQDQYNFNLAQDQPSRSPNLLNLLTVYDAWSKAEVCCTGRLGSLVRPLVRSFEKPNSSGGLK